jgi:DNA polymerase-3 subunit epsilon
VKILGLDVETTGLLAAEDRITEVGACLFDWDTQTPLVILSTLVEPGIPIPEEITKLTGITDGMVEDFGRKEDDVMADLHYLIQRANYVMAHNAAFDKGFVEAAMFRNGFTNQGAWVCSKNDIKYPESITTRHLNYLAAEAGFVNPWKHRAIFDVMTMLRLASAYDLDAIIARSLEPTLFVQALVSFDEKELAKARGYRWYAPTKTWWREFKSSDYDADKQECGFRTQLLTKAPE